MFQRAGFDGFIIALLLMILLARLWPEGSLEWKGFSISRLAGYGVSIIFFFYGLRLDPVKLKAGLQHWRLHLLVHLTTFGLFPFIAWATKWIFEGSLYYDLWLGFFFLSTLPSTVSSSVVMVSIARGNMAAAIFNASISSLIGVFITPLWMSLVMDSIGNTPALGDIIIKLVLQVLVPVIAGILLNKQLGYFAERNKKILKMFDQAVILLIVYTSFADSFLNKRFETLDLLTLVIMTFSMVVLFFVVFFIIRYFCRLLNFNREDTIAAVFCGSKKSLVHGTVMSKVLFNASPLTGIILLPLMIYHACQLLIASILAKRFNEKASF